MTTLTIITSFRLSRLWARALPVLALALASVLAFPARADSPATPDAAKDGEKKTAESAPTATEKVVKMEKLTVTETAANGYLVTSTSTGGKGDFAPNEIPQHVTAIPAQVIEDQALHNVTDAMKNVAGVTNSYPDYYALDYMTSAYIRGFTVSATLRDGLWDPTPFGNSWLGDVDQIEVLKGPAGLLYGAYSGDVGGVINVITKKPSAEPFLRVTGTVDTHGSRSVASDFSLPVSRDQRWLLRTNLGSGFSEGFADNTTAKSRNGSAIVQGRVTDNDTLTVSYEKRWQETEPYSGLPGFAKKGSGTTAYLAPLGSFPNSLNVYDPRSDWTYDSDTARAVLDHRFSPSWLVRSSTHFSQTSRFVRSISATPAFLSDGSIKYTESYSEIHMGPTKTLDTDTFVQGGFSTASLAHKLAAGARFTRETYDMNMSAPTTSFSLYSFTDPLSPNWGQPIVGLRRSIYGDADIHQRNGYVNDVITVLPGLRFSGGINFVNYSVFSESGSSPATESGSGYKADGHGQRAGLLYDLRPGWTLFTDIATTFKPQSPTTTTDGKILTFDPLTGQQKEFGLKIDLQQRATLTASVYQIDLTNVLASDPDPARATLGYQVQTGKQISRGFELDGTVRVTPNWNLLVAYANTQATYHSSSTYLVGSWVPNTPRQSLRLWNQYEIRTGVLIGLGFGAGSTTVTSRTTNLVTTASPRLVATLPGYTAVDALVYYRIGRARISLNVRNLLNRDYWASATSYTWLFKGEPRRAQLSASYTF